MEFIVKYSGPLSDIAAGAGAKYEDLGLGYAIFEGEPSLAAALAADARVADVEPERTAFLESTAALELSCVPQGRESAAPPLTGEGTVVGIIDTGVDFTHPDFRRPDGSTRIAAMLDLPRKAVYTAADIDAALGSGDPFAVIPRPYSSGHGTAVAGIAAGNGYGVAPGAALVVARAGGDGALTTAIMRAAAFVVARAAGLGAPLCCNLSYGLNAGPRRGDTLFEGYLDALSLSGRCTFFAPTGNEGGSGRHFSAGITTGSAVGAEFFVGDSVTSAGLLAVSDFADDLSFEVIFPDGTASGAVSPKRREVAFTRGGAALSLVCDLPDRYTTSLSVRARLASDGGLPPGIWTLRVAAGEVVDGRVDCWISGDAAFALPDPYLTMTLPSTARRICAVAGYDPRTRAVAGFSGRGSRDGAVAPDLCAPAVGVISARAGGGYDAFTGTSFASPYVCGAAALAAEWGVARGNDPLLCGDRMIAFLRRGARREPGAVCPDPLYGYGALCAGRVMSELIDTEGG